MDNPNLNRFLKIIAQLETSGGTNLNHPVIQSGIHEGDSAQGTYGMMPNTMDELKNRFPKLRKETDPDVFAKALANQVLDKAGGDETLAAGMWHQGHNTPPDKYDKVRSSDYAQKYEEIRKRIPSAVDPNPYYNKPDETIVPDYQKLKNLIGK